jgi:hypothetical protein
MFTFTFRRLAVATIAGALGLGVLATPATASTDVSSSAGASAEVVGSTRISNVGTTLVTVKGEGFANLAVGNRPPLAGRPTGVYVVFGRFDENWKPSAGAPASSRRTVLASQRWALPAASRPFVDPTGVSPEVITMGADGSFTAQIPVSAIDGTGTYAIAVYPASGAINAAHEFLIPLTFASPFNPLVGTKSSVNALAGYAGLEISAKSKVSASVRSDAKSMCRVSANGKQIEHLKVGKCITFISVRTGDTTIIKRIPLTIAKK